MSRKLLRRAQRGQSVVVALLVLLLLGLVGALFITVVARNLVNARRANRVVTADYYARSGITFADAQLTNSLQGADWRPPLQYALLNAPTEMREANRYASQALPAINANDPDKEYLEQGFARYNTGAGRFLLRLTYDPVNLNSAPVPPGRYIKIESIGREGVIDPIDPTTYSNNRSSDRLQAYQVAYKPLGFTDYARFETNPDKRSDVANIGVVSQYCDVDVDGNILNTDGKIATPGVYDFQSPVTQPLRLYPIATTYGATDAYLRQTATGQITLNPTAGSGQSAPAGYTFLPGGGSIHANMTTRFYGKNIVYMYDAGADAPTYQDTMEIAGDLLLDNYDPSISLDNKTFLPTSGMRAPDEGQQASLVINPPASAPTPIGDYASPSNDTGNPPPNGGFDTFGGLLRDGSGQPDVKGQPRGISRLEPPVMDGLDSASALPRYKVLAMMSPPRLDPSTAAPGTPYASGSSQYGYGRAIYINNSQDIQPESQAIGGGSTLTNEWLNRPHQAAGTVGGWNGDLYDPVGVNITLGMQNTSLNGASATVAGIRLTRSPGTAWTDSSGNALSGTASDGTSASTMVIPYASLSASNDLMANPAGLTAAAQTNYQNNPNNDVVLYAEGNIRVHGIASPNEGSAASPLSIPRHITLVTNGTAYIDGNLLKGDPDSTITILAHDYVCVNTTQFLAGPRPDENQYNAQAITETVGTGALNSLPLRRRFHACAAITRLELWAVQRRKCRYSLPRHDQDGPVCQRRRGKRPERSGGFQPRGCDRRDALF